MANRFWVGGTANWDSTAGTKWATTSGGAGGAAVPTTSDDVFFDANSGAVTVTVSGTQNCNSLDFTGFTGTFAGITFTINVGAGNVKFVSGMTVTWTGFLSFGNAAALQTLTTAGKVFGGIGITKTSTNTLQLLDDLTTTVSGGVTLTSGKLDCNGFNINAGTFNANNSNTRSVAWGPKLELSGTGTVINLTSAVNYTHTNNTTLEIVLSNTSGTSRTITCQSQFQCGDFKVTGGTGSIAGSANLESLGNVDLTGFSGTITSVVLRATTSGKTVNWGSASLTGSLMFNGVGGEWTLSTDIVGSGSAVLTLSAGTLNVNNKNINLTGNGSIATSGSTTKVVNWGSGTITCSRINIAGSALTWNYDTAHWQLNPHSAAGSSAMGGLTYYSMDITMQSGSNSSNIGSSAAWSVATDLTFDTVNGGHLTFGSDVNITGTLGIERSSGSKVALIASTNIGTNRTFTAGALGTLGECLLRDITISAPGTPWAPTARVGDGGRVVGVSFSAPETRYWVGNGGNIDDTTHWSLTSGGAGGASRPLPQDTGRFDANSFSSGTQTVTITGGGTSAFISGMDFTGVTNSPTLAWGTSVDVYGSLTLVSGMSISGTGTWNIYDTNTITYTMAGKSFPNSIQLNSFTGTWQLGDAFSGVAIAFQSGAFNSNNHNITLTGSFTTSGSGPRTLTLGTSTIESPLSGAVFGLSSAGTTLSAANATFKSTNNSASAKSFALATGQVIGTLWIAGGGAGIWLISPATGAGATINTLKVDNAPRFVTVTSGRTLIVGALDMNGSAGNLNSLKSGTNGNIFNIQRANEGIPLVADYLTLQDSVAIGGASGGYYAGSNSTNVSGNSGWQFTEEQSWLEGNQLVPDLTHEATLALDDAGFVANMTIPNLTQTATLSQELRIVAVQSIADVPSVASAEAEVHLSQTAVIPALGQIATVSREASALADQLIPDALTTTLVSVEVQLEASQTIPDVTSLAVISNTIGLIGHTDIPDLETEALAEVEVLASADQAIPPVAFSGHFEQPVSASANQLIPAVGSLARLVTTWVPIIPYGLGAQLLYRNSTGLEKAMAEVDTERLFNIKAELIIENWDPYLVQSRNIPWLAYGMGVTLWEEGHWSEATKRRWLDQQWTYKSLRGTIGGIRMALSVSGYDLCQYLTPPQGFYAAPPLPPEDYNSWIRLMPELRLTYGQKRGVATWREWYVGEGFIDDSFLGTSDGFALRGRYAFLRHLGVDTPLHFIEYASEEEETASVKFERVSVPGKSTLGFFIGETFVAEDAFPGFAEIEPRLYTLRLDQTLNADVSKVHLTTLTPTLEPLSPTYEVNSDIGDGNGWFFIGDFIGDERFLDWEDGGEFLLAQRMYLLDPAVAAPLTLGSSFVGIDRVSMPTYTFEAMIDLNTNEGLPSIFIDDAFVGINFAVPEDPEHVDRALRSVVDAKALRDTALVTMAPRQLVTMGDIIHTGTKVAEFVTKIL